MEGREARIERPLHRASWERQHPISTVSGGSVGDQRRIKWGIRRVRCRSRVKAPSGNGKLVINENCREKNTKWGKWGIASAIPHKIPHFSQQNASAGDSLRLRSS